MYSLFVKTELVHMFCILIDTTLSRNCLKFSIKTELVRDGVDATEYIVHCTCTVCLASVSYMNCAIHSIRHRPGFYLDI